MNRTTSARILSAVILVIMTGTLLGCRNEDRPPEPINSCQIFTDSEVNILFDPSVERPPTENHKVDEKTGHWMSSCNYYSPETNLSAGILIKPFFPYQKTVESAYESYAKDIKANLPDYEMKKISDVGAQAVWNGQLGQLTFFEGKQMVIVSILQKSKNEEEKLTFCKKIAKALIDKKIL